jgi:hypothetical protein
MSPMINTGAMPQGRNSPFGWSWPMTCVDVSDMI